MLKGWQKGREWYLSLASVQRSQRIEPLNLQYKRTSSFLSPYSKKTSPHWLCPNPPQGKDNWNGTHLYRQTPQVHAHPSTGPDGPAKPRPCHWEKHLRAETSSSEAFPARWGTNLLLLPCHSENKIKTKQKKTSLLHLVKDTNISLWLLFFSYLLIYTQLFIVSSPTKGLKWPIGIYTTHWNRKMKSKKGKILCSQGKC